jgi:hypothetical protein
VKDKAMLDKTISVPQSDLWGQKSGYLKICRKMPRRFLVFLWVSLLSSDKYSRRVRDLHLLKKLSAVLDQVKQDEGLFFSRSIHRKMSALTAFALLGAAVIRTRIFHLELTKVDFS